MTAIPLPAAPNTRRRSHPSPKRRRHHEKRNARQMRILGVTPCALRPGEIGVVGFAGIGGWCTGWLQAVGVPPAIAVNHDKYAISVHRANHPECRHYREDIWGVDMRGAVHGRPVGWAHLSPDCRDHSRAKGGKPVSKRVRGLAWAAKKWSAQISPRIVSIENVPEFIGWGPLVAKRCKVTRRVLKVGAKRCGDDGHFCAAAGEHVPLREQQLARDPRRAGKYFRKLVRELESMGYAVEWRELRACDYGAATSRKRLFVMGRRDGRLVRWPELTHGQIESAGVKEGRLLPFRTAADCIDWTDLGRSIFDRKKPLVDATLRRTAVGVNRYVLKRRPFIVNLTHGARVEDVDEPARTITSAHRGEKAVVTPLLIQTGYGERQGQAPRVLDLQQPLGTVVAQGQKHGLVAAFLAKHNDGNASFGISVDGPSDTITTKDHHAVVTAALVQQNYGNGQWQAPETPLHTATQSNHHSVISAGLVKLRGTSTTADVEEPSPTITSQGTHLGLVTAHIVEYYGQGGQHQPVNAPLNTVTVKERFALVVEFLERFIPGLHFPDRIAKVVIDGATYVIVDIFMRMLKPRELARCTGFDDDYVLHGTIGQQVAGIGNAVPPAFARALAAANLDDEEPEEVAA